MRRWPLTPGWTATSIWVWEAWAWLCQFLAHPWLRPEGAIMETPKRHPADEWRNLLVARSLVESLALAAPG